MYINSLTSSFFAQFLHDFLLEHDMIEGGKYKKIFSCEFFSNLLTLRRNRQIVHMFVQEPTCRVYNSYYHILQSSGILTTYIYIMQVYIDSNLK